MKVVDASVIVKLFIEEAGSDAAIKLTNDEDLVVPNLLYIEVGNTLATKAQLSLSQVEEGLDLIYGLGLRVENVDRELLTAASTMAKQMGTSVYDMVYAALARRLGVELVTADKKFVSKTKFDFVKLLS